MTLTTRVSMLFLAMLAVVLAGFSISLYLLARAHLHQQAGERLEAALNTLAAVAEVGPEGIEWEPAGRPLNVGPATLGDQIAWRVSDNRGQTVDQSRQPGGDELASSNAQPPGGWQILHRRIGPAAGIPAPTIPAASPEEGRKYAALTITVGLSLQPVWSMLERLAWVLGALCVGIWLVALVLGRVVCRRALRPVTLMAAAAREMRADDLGRRLAPSTSGDELEDLTQAFNGLLDRLQEAIERERRFTSDASHQLRTPVAMILGQIEVALRRERPAEEYRRVLGVVEQRAGHLGRLVESLLFLARAGADARLPDLECVHLSEWLGTYRQTWADHPRAGDLQFVCEGNGSGEIDAHPVLLGELMTILVDNACKFSRPGTPIVVRGDLGPDAVGLCVSDQGCGIREAEVPLLFTPFFRSPNASGGEGVGLGLSIAKRLTEAFGGTLTVSSKVGQGSTFSVRLFRSPASGAVCRRIVAELPAYLLKGLLQILHGSLQCRSIMGGSQRLDCRCCPCGRVSPVAGKVRGLLSCVLEGIHVIAMRSSRLFCVFLVGGNAIVQGPVVFYQVFLLRVLGREILLFIFWRIRLVIPREFGRGLALPGLVLVGWLANAPVLIHAQVVLHCLFFQVLFYQLFGKQLLPVPCCCPLLRRGSSP